LPNTPTNHRIRSIRLLLAILIMTPVAVLADAGQGEFMGYKLGDSYTVSDTTVMRSSASGNLIISAEAAVKPADIAEVSLLTTSESYAIGYIDAAQWFETEAQAREFGRKYYQILRAKYFDWVLGQERMNSDLQITELGFTKSPYSLQMRLEEDEHDGEPKWRLSMRLSWTNDSKEARAWRNMARTQHIAADEEGRQQVLKDADLRGL